MIIDQLKILTHQLGLDGINNSLERRAQEALSQQLHPLEFLRLLLEDERLAKKDRYAKRLITSAKFRYSADLEDWDTSFDRGLTKQRLRELCALGFYHNNENALIFGKTGEGKTHFSIALGRRLCQENIKTAFLPVNFLFEEIMAEKAAGNYLGFIKNLARSKVIILDDFGLRQYTHEEATALMDILEERYQKGSVIVTAQVDSNGWHKLFEDPIIAEAIIERLTKPSQKILLRGGSYRDKIQDKKNKHVAQNPVIQ